MITQKGKLLEYLGMTLDFSEEKEVNIKIDAFVERLLANYPEGMKGGSKTLAVIFLFDANPNAEKLNEGHAKKFHTISAKLLFLRKCAHRDTQTAVVFLTTCVTSPDVDNCKKLSCAINYLSYTKTSISFFKQMDSAS